MNRVIPHMWLIFFLVILVLLTDFLWFIFFWCYIFVLLFLIIIFFFVLHIPKLISNRQLLALCLWSWIPLSFYSTSIWRSTFSETFFPFLFLKLFTFSLFALPLSPFLFSFPSLLSFVVRFPPSFSSSLDFSLFYLFFSSLGYNSEWVTKRSFSLFPYNLYVLQYLGT